MMDSNNIAIIYDGITEKKGYRNRKKIKRSGVQIIIRYMMVCLATFIIGISLGRGYSKIKEISNNESIYDEKNSLAYNIDEVVKLEQDTWENLSNTEKMAVLQIIVNVEGRYLGIDKSVRLYAEDLDDSIKGFYYDKRGLIVINKDILYGESRDAVEVVAHECMHASQHTLVRILNSLNKKQQNSIYMWKANVYRNEFDRYVDGREDWYMYMTQECERDARNYGRESTNEIYSRINKYRETGNPN